MIVKNLKARTGCQGLAIYLTWDLPSGEGLTMKVVRRANDWNYYLDSSCDVLYVGAPIAGLDDIPGKSWVPLAGDTFYYYTVVVSPVFDPADTDYEVATESRTFALSIDALDGKGWIWKRIPRDMKRRDAQDKLSGGGGGDLDKWATVMGCWLNLVRGKQKSILLHNDESKTPYPLAKLKNEGWGATPEDGYDFTVVRKYNEKAAHLATIRGSCPSLVEVIKIYTDWDSQCVDLADTVNTGCAGPKPLATYDGISPFTIVDGADYVLRAEIEVRVREGA